MAGEGGGGGGAGGGGTAGFSGTAGSSVEAPPPCRAIRRLRESRAALCSDDGTAELAGAGGSQPDSITLRSGSMYFSSAFTLPGGGCCE